MANIVVAYVCWLFGGWLGLHHFYLGRDKHAFVWWTSLGGFILGWIRDLWRLPEYVHESNEDTTALELQGARQRLCPTPPFSTLRFTGEMSVGFLFGFLCAGVIPEDLIEDSMCLYLRCALALLGTSVGVWLVANIGWEKGSFLPAVAGGMLSIPWLMVDTGNVIITSMLSAVALNWKGRKWRKVRSPRRRSHFCKRVLVLSLCGCLYLSLWGTALYFNAYISMGEDEEKVPLREAIQNFFTSPAWQDFKNSAKIVYNYYQVHGWYKLWEEIKAQMDPTGEVNAYKVLGLEEGASEEEIQKRYKQLVKQYHPDKVKDEDHKQEAQEKFIEIQKAYELLSTKKVNRAKKSKKSRSHTHSEF